MFFEKQKLSRVKYYSEAKYIQINCNQRIWYFWQFSDDFYDCLVNVFLRIACDKIKMFQQKFIFWNTLQKMQSNALPEVQSIAMT
jgi:hypothetical protein